MGSDNEDDTSSVPGGETSADYLISESGKQTETTKAKKSGFDCVTDKIKEKVTGPDSVTDKIKEKVTGAGESIKEREQRHWTMTTMKQKILIRSGKSRGDRRRRLSDSDDHGPYRESCERAEKRLLKVLSQKSQRRVSPSILLKGY